MFPSFIDPGAVNIIDSDNISRLEFECNTNLERATEQYFLPNYKKGKKYAETINTSTALYYANLKFRKDITRFPKFNNELKEKAEKYFGLTIEKLGNVLPNSIICSLTDSNSIYFRFYKDTYVCHMEVFYDFDNTNDDIEAIFTLYENQNIILKQYGYLDSIFEKITEKIDSGENDTFELENALDELSV